MGGTSDVEKDFCFFPFRPGERGRILAAEEWPLMGRVRRVAREFCSVMG